MQIAQNFWPENKERKMLKYLRAKYFSIFSAQKKQ